MFSVETEFAGFNLQCGMSRRRNPSMNQINEQRTFAKCLSLQKIFLAKRLLLQNKLFLKSYILLEKIYPQLRQNLFHVTFTFASPPITRISWFTRTVVGTLSIVANSISTAIGCSLDTLVYVCKIQPH